MVRVTFRSVEPGMGNGMYGGGRPPRDDRTGEAIGTRNAERTIEMGDGTCSGRVTLYGGAV